jgi:CRISPR-associated protein Csd2
MPDAIENRYEFVYFFDVENGNPNGDPDAGNMPRIDPETSHGLVTDVCLKRKIRNFIQIAKGGQPPYEIYVKEKGVLNQENDRAYINNPDIERPPQKKLPKKTADALRITRWMCDNFYDIRTFGAVMTTEVNCGQVRGPVQLNFARSIDPIIPLEISITRMAVTNERDLEKERTMGRKHIVPYALYRAEGYLSASLAEKTGFSETDRDMLWDSLINMFDHDHSAARGKMNARRLIVFQHDSRLGNAPAHKLFDSVRVERANDPELPPRAFSDYKITVDTGSLPEGIALQEKL